MQKVCLPRSTALPRNLRTWMRRSARHWYLVGQRRLAGTGRAFDDVDATLEQAAMQDLVEPRDGGRKPGHRAHESLRGGNGLFGCRSGLLTFACRMAAPDPDDLALATIQ